ncbi:Synergin gamma [Varanus komodoensis]|nr:Synergin gamma [Varanus komodoensis]
MAHMTVGDKGSLGSVKPWEHLCLHRGEQCWLSNAMWLLPPLFFISSVLWQMDPETARLMRCLQQIHKVIGKGSEIFASTSQPSVCKEVLLSAPGTAYILGLSEVYRVSRRLEEGMKARKLASELLQHTLREVDMAWNNVLSFLVLGQSVFPLLAHAGNSDPVMHQGSYYHAGCANFWLNCVDSILPRET